MSRDDWRQSVPDSETLEQLFDRARRKSDVPAAPRFGVSPVRIPPRPTPRSAPRPSSRVVISTGLALKAPEKPADEPRGAPATIRFGTAPPMPPAGPPPRVAAPAPPVPIESFADVLLDDSPRPPRVQNGSPAPAPAPSAPFAPASSAVAPAPVFVTPPAAVRFGTPPPDPRPRIDTLPPPRRQLVTLPFLQKRSLTTGGSIAVSALTAAVVAGAAFGLSSLLRTPVTPVTSMSHPVEAPPVAVPPLPLPLPSPSPSPTSAATAPPPIPAAPPPEELPFGYGRFTVVSSRDADVYLTGKRAGPANTALDVRCGTWFVRLAQPGEDFPPEWVGAGQTVRIACQAATTVELGGAQSSLVLKRR